MKKMFMIVSNLLVAVSGLFGMGMAVTIPNNGADTDPNENTPLNGATNDAPGKGIDQQGQGATGSAMDQAGLTDNDVDDYVAMYKSYKYAMHTDFMTKARQVQVDTKEPTVYEIGEAVLDCTTKGAFYSGSESSYTPAESVTADVNMIYKTDLKLFAEGATVLVEDVEGYDGTTKDGSPLMLYVESTVKNTSVTFSAVNGILSGGVICVPFVPAGAVMHIMAPALSESEIEVTPDAAYPKDKTMYLQKKVCAMTYTDLFQRIKKKANWNVQDLKDWVLDNFRKKCTRSLLIGKQSKFVKVGSGKTGSEYCYTQEGVLRQIRLGYEVSSLTFEDLIGIHSMLFTKYAKSNVMDVYCGTGFLESLLNINFSNHPEVSFVRKEDGITKIMVTSFTTNFGTTNFVHEYALDDLGYSNCAIAFDMSSAKRFFYPHGDISIDHAKGEGGAVREAKSEFYIQDDTLALTDLNSMLIGPSVDLVKANKSEIAATIKSVSSFPTSPSKGDLVYLTKATTTNAVGLYKYNGTSWEVYQGNITA